MKKLNKAVMILAKIAEVLVFIGMIASIVAAVVFALGKTGGIDALPGDLHELSTSGFTLAMADGALPRAALVLFSVTLALSLGCLTMIFRNVYLIFRTSEGKTSFAKGVTPFQKDNVRMVREIGIFMLLLVAIECIMGCVAKLVLGVDQVEISLDLTRVLFGLVMLALSQYFAYGMELQQDVDGLL